MKLRREIPADIREIRTLTDAAFADAPHSSGTEGAIIDALRAEQQLALSLVAVDAGRLVGHIAFSPVTISDGAAGWYGLGPMAVRPGDQGVASAPLWSPRGCGISCASGRMAVSFWAIRPSTESSASRLFRLCALMVLRPSISWRAVSSLLPEGEVCYHKAFYGA
ncbi:N-acetyltransferase [Paracoccus cavernae]|uniref:N-acetyltransferase n=1 Tax=Paracoccus cavernae TaxID=1571207 RepID=A0ABT8DAH4_9RHOB|nr:N-acetyltransferase [Paracoccus cavernae]